MIEIWYSMGQWEDGVYDEIFWYIPAAKMWLGQTSRDPDSPLEEIAWTEIFWKSVRNGGTLLTKIGEF